MNNDLFRQVVAVAMAGSGDYRIRKARGRAAWRAFVIESNRLERIVEAKARGLSLIEAAAARADDPMRRLRLHRGQWQMRITITTDPREVGERELIPLETADLSEAQKMRDLLERVFDRIGLLSSRATAGIK